MISALDMRILDRNAGFFGVSILQLMENAGREVARVAREVCKVKGKKVAILCGSRNNGGDGFVAARYLREYCDVTVVLLKKSDSIGTKEARENFERVKNTVTIREEPANLSDALEASDLIIDAMLGVGLYGAVKEPYASAIDAINRSGKPVLSVDVPSGLGADKSVRPTVTVALDDIKEGMNKDNSGDIVVVDIGMPREVKKAVGPGDFLLYPLPRPDSHKGDNGRLMVVSGGPFTGAPALVGLAAYRIGVDVVHIFTPASSYQAVASFSPNLIVHRLPGERLRPETVGKVLNLAEDMHAAVVGPGLGDAGDTKRAIRKIISSLNIPLVIDADAITAVGEDVKCLRSRKGVVTPHAHEFQVLTSEKLPENSERRIQTVMKWAAKLNFTILQKAKVDVISDGKDYRLNRTGNPGMTVGGTGDVLAGLVGGLLAKGAAPFEAARMAAFANGYAGDLALKEKSYGLMATDVLEKIPSVLLEFLPT